MSALPERCASAKRLLPPKQVIMARGRSAGALLNIQSLMRGMALHFQPCHSSHPDELLRFHPESLGGPQYRTLLKACQQLAALPEESSHPPLPQQPPEHLGNGLEV